MADPPTFTQTHKRLEIHTILDALEADPDIDPFLLIWAKGSEEVSQPYTYFVKMWRLVNRQRPPIPPGDLINTRVEVRLNLKETVKDDPDSDAAPGSEVRSHVRRCGVFETFNDEGFVLGEPVKVLGTEFRLRQYSATIVPAFKMMAYETPYRVFENKNVEQIIDEVADGFPHLKINKDRLSNTFFPKMQYCVQFNETSFNFLSRLMARFGIWYYFDHNREPNDNFSIMMLGAGRSQFDKCEVHGRELLADHPIHKLTEINNKDLAPSALTVKDFQRIYAPTTRRARFGNFNILNPVDPITNATNMQAARDVIVPPRTLFGTKGRRVEPDDDERFHAELFAAPVDLNNESPDAPSAETYSRDWMRWRESLVARVSGSSRNIALIPGFTFDRISPPSRPVDQDEEPIGREQKAAADAGADIVAFTNPKLPKPNVQTLGTYVLLHVEFEGMVAAYTEKKDLAEVLGDLLFPKNLTTDDLLANSTVQGLNDYLQKAVPQQIKDGTMPDLDLGSLLPGGSPLGMVAKLIPLIQKIVEELKDKSTSDFHCSFAAIPLELIDYQGDGFPTTQARLFSLPLPSGWNKPSVSGPHLAVVIGQDGTKTDPNEIFADPFGRVRVRFPWDRKKKEKPGDSFKRGDNACWVRVSEAWAGRQFGTQFLPRIGQEVIVDFLDGDPDRPIITGRVYNADHGFANLPFTKAEVDLEIIEQKDLLQPVGGPEYRFEGIKTSSTPSPGANAKPRYHLTRWDDKLNCEQYLIRSQGRLDVTAFAHSFETTYGNKNVRVVPGKDKDGKTFGGSEFTTVGGEYDLHIGDNRYEGVDKGYQLTVKTDTIFDLETAHHTIVGTESTLNAKTIVIEAPVKITLKVGSSFVVLDPAGVWIQGPVVMINSGGTPGVTTDQDLVDVADAEAAEPGDQWMKRVTTCNPHPPGGGGARGHHTAAAKHGLPVTFNPADQSFSVGAHGKIKVDGKDKNFADSAITDLATIDQTPSGHALLGRLDSSSHTTTIAPQTPVADGSTHPANGAAARVPGTPGTLDAAGNPIPGAGTGSDSRVDYSPTFYPANKTNEPGDVALFHELTHADHSNNGTIDQTPRSDNFDNQEEFNTIQDENKYRTERGPWPGMPAPPNNLRTDHHDA